MTCKSRGFEPPGHTHTHTRWRKGRCDEANKCSGEGGRGDAMRRVCQQRGSKYSRERGAGRERRTGGIFKSKKLEA